LSRCHNTLGRVGVNLTYARGESGVTKVTVERPSGAEFDLSQFGLIYRVVSLDNDQVVFEKTLGQGIRAIDLASGKVELVFEVADTDHSPGTYAHELRITDGADYTESVMSGYFNIEPSIF